MRERERLVRRGRSWRWIGREPACARRSDRSGAGYALLNYGDRATFDAVFREINTLITRTPDAGVQVYPLSAIVTRAIYDGDLEGAVDAAARVAVRGEEVGPRC